MKVHDKVNLVAPMGLEEDPHAPRRTHATHVIQLGQGHWMIQQSYITQFSMICMLWEV
ncbi:unnamed protein product [Lupinus luteus]|uniref:LTI65/LTI78 NYQTKV repeat domain-containing protein n=1 Tax=Lupinus luteus TaxID=3873 RepID=A0AAV1VWB5_LUPLU